MKDQLITRRNLMQAGAVGLGGLIAQNRDRQPVVATEAAKSLFPLIEPLTYPDGKMFDLANGRTVTLEHVADGALLLGNVNMVHASSEVPFTPNAGEKYLQATPSFIYTDEGMIELQKYVKEVSTTEGRANAILAVVNSMYQEVEQGEIDPSLSFTERVRRGQAGPVEKAIIA